MKLKEDIEKIENEIRYELSTELSLEELISKFKLDKHSISLRELHNILSGVFSDQTRYILKTSIKDGLLLSILTTMIERL